MSKKIYQVVIYKSISDEEKLAKYAALAGPAIKGAGGKFLARGIPVMTKESGEKTRTVVLAVSYTHLTLPTNSSV